MSSTSKEIADYDNCYTTVILISRTVVIFIIHIHFMSPSKSIMFVVNIPQRLWTTDKCTYLNINMLQTNGNGHNYYIQ